MKIYFYFLKQHKMAGPKEKEFISKGAEGVEAEGDGMTQLVNDKRCTLENNLNEEKTIDIGLIRAYASLGINIDRLPEILQKKGFYNGDIDKIKKAINDLCKLSEKMTISPDLDPDLNKKVQEVMKNMKKNPHLYKAGEDVTSYSTTKNKDGSYSIDGSSFHSVLSKGDYLVIKCTIGGEPGYLRAIITDIEYTNPREYFKGNMIVVNFCNEDGSDID